MVCDRGAQVIGGGGSLLDALERGINQVELDPTVQTVGLGGLPNEEGVVQLDAMIMDGTSLLTGAVGALEEIATPISVARRVMERTRHVYLVGAGAKQFALGQGFTTRPLLTAESRREWELWRASGSRGFWRGERPAPPSPADHDTVGAVAHDGRGHVACGLSTSGLAWKLSGRIGDSPIVGSGGYADDEGGAAAATGVGEEIIRVAGSHAVVEGMRRGLSPDEAIAEVLRRIRRRRGADLGQAQVAFVAVRTDGEIGTGALQPGFVAAIHRAGSTTLRPVNPLG